MRKLKRADSFEESFARSGAYMEVAKDGGPVRKVFNGRRHRPVGLYPSVKSDRMIAWESRLERKTIRWLEVETSFVEYLEQPHRLWFPFEGRRTHYTPDFEVKIPGGSFYVEVKYRQFLREMERREWKRFWKARYIYNAAGKSLVFVTDLRFKTHAVWHENARLVEEARRLLPTADTLSSIVTHLEAAKQSTLGACADAIRDPELGPQRLMALMLRRIVAIDLNQPVSAQSSVSLCPGYRERLGNIVRQGQPENV